MRRIAVIGLGRFGTALAQRLMESGVQVIAVDRDARLVAEIKDEVDVAVRLDSTDHDALLSQGIDKVDACVIAIGEHFEAALLTTVLVKQLGVPRIICRAQTSLHAEIFRQIGADQVIQPEQAAGILVARQLAHPYLADVIPLSDDFALVELNAPRAFQGQTIRDLGLRAAFDVNLVMIKRPQSRPGRVSDTPPLKIVVPRPEETIEPGDILVLVGPNDALAKLPKE